jgi:hypothetical protein
LVAFLVVVIAAKECHQGEFVVRQESIEAFLMAAREAMVMSIYSPTAIIHCTILVAHFVKFVDITSVHHFNSYPVIVL